MNNRLVEAIKQLRRGCELTGFTGVPVAFRLERMLGGLSERRVAILNGLVDGTPNGEDGRRLPDRVWL
jgi:hypothetical protein